MAFGNDSKQNDIPEMNGKEKLERKVAKVSGQKYIKKDDTRKKNLSIRLTERQIELLKEHFEVEKGFGLSTGIRTLVIEYMKLNDIN